MGKLNTLSVPLTLCRDLGLYGGSAHALRMLLVAEHHRRDGAREVDVPLATLLSATGSRSSTLDTGLRHMLDVRCAPPGQAAMAACVDELGDDVDERPAWDGEDEPMDDDDEDAPALPPQPVLPAEGPDRGTYVSHRVPSYGDARAVPGRLHVALGDAWIAHVAGPRVELPIAELRALQTRCGMVMRLRAAALLADADSATVNLTTGDWSLYTTHHRRMSPAGVVRGYLLPGLADIGQACPTLSVGLRERRRKSRIVGVDLTFRQESPRVASSRAPRVKAMSRDPGSRTSQDGSRTS